MTTTTTTDTVRSDHRSAGRIVISAWSAVSPYGLGRLAFCDGVREGAAPVADDPASDPDGPLSPRHLVPEFDIREVLGRKGTRSMDRATALAVTGVRELLADGGTSPADDGERTACVLATTTGSARSMMDFTRDSLTGDRPYLVDPARFPNTVMNCAAGQSAIWHDLRGPNATIAGGRVAGLHALNYSRRLLAADRAATVLCGAVEEYSSTRSWLEHHARGEESGPGISEGCTMLRIEPAGATSTELAAITAVRFGSFTDDDVDAAVTRCVDDVLGSAGIHADAIWQAVVTGAPGEVGRAEREAVTARLGRPPVVLSDTLGDSGAASACFAIATVLAAAQADPAPEARHALVLAADREGIVGAAILTVPATTAAPCADEVTS